MASARPAGKPQRRGEITKRRLIAATRGLLGSADYQSITLDQIAREVGVAKSSIIWHFGDKETLLTEAVFALFEEIDEQINLAKPRLATYAERCRFLLKAVARYFADNPEAKGISITLLFDRRVPARIHERIREQWHQHVTEIREYLSTEMEPASDTQASALMAFMHGFYLQWHLQGCPDDIERRLLSAWDALAGRDTRSSKGSG